VIVGAKTFTEQYILSAMIARRVEQATGQSAQLIQSLGSTVAFDALRSSDIDVYVDYSGTLWTTILGRTDVPTRQAVLEEVGAHLDREYGIGLIGSLGFENAYALAVRRADADRLGLRAIGDLAPHAPRMTMGGDYEFFARPEWQSIQQAYDLQFQDRRSMESTLMYQAIAESNVDVISAFSTDGRIAALDLRVLTDDRGAIPPYDAVLLASPRLRRDRPEVLDALAVLAGAIDADAMRRMNLAVDAGGRSPSAVADEFLDRLAPGAAP
jgi:osmoprotectant transport system permease protein